MSDEADEVPTLVVPEGTLPTIDTRGAEPRVSEVPRKTPDEAIRDFAICTGQDPERVRQIMGNLAGRPLTAETLDEAMETMRTIHRADGTPFEVRPDQEIYAMGSRLPDPDVRDAMGRRWHLNPYTRKGRAARSALPFLSKESSKSATPDAPTSRTLSPEAYGEESADGRWTDPRSEKIPLTCVDVLAAQLRFRRSVRGVGSQHDREILVQRAIRAFRARWADSLAARDRIVGDPASLGRAVAQARWDEDPEARVVITPELASSLSSSCEATLLEVGIPEADADKLLPEALRAAAERWAELLRMDFPVLPKELTDDGSR